ncbi:hypothetical protein GGI15_002087 [Coemansia interrupta]|uniref:NmrA-like domain-containing protein n=1 Tax=Coemansia interrupta TaxID=1126814 RepID=A0A9W8HH91_9FUNG|nr:hypothetical protein GGI15_002087 [Coemansia interrupta]
MSKLISIIGATGLQGGSVLKTLYGTGQYKIRALTRNPTSDAAKKLQAAYPNIELAAADLDAPETLQKAFAGSDVVFGVTQFFQKDILERVHQGDLDAEFNQGKAMVDAAIAANVPAMVYSSLDSMKQISSGKYPGVVHFDGKHRIEEYLASKMDKIRGYFVYAGFYMNNYMDFARRSPEDGAVEFSFPIKPTAKLPLVDTANDIGPVVSYILDHPEECLGTVCEASGGYYEAQDMVKAFTEVTGKPARYVQIPYEYLGNEELEQMFRGIEEFGLFNGRTDFIERNNTMKYKFTTPVEFWQRNGWTGPEAQP